ncbi:hypothetical protein R5W23_000477 [Gemmata sp. JC673]|uniref:SMI1/KNR4 family protein n=2 Tax=Gemmata algarum TaxID=2975278 RepID=A0ABU5F0U6_9BACT|nr:hypothetical protein [Gemmata algarum]
MTRPMTEDEWFSPTDDGARVRHAAEHLPPRHRRLLAVGLCRTVTGLVTHPALAAALDVVDQYADGRVTAGALERARHACRALAQQSYDAYRRAADTGGSAVAAHACWDLAWAVSFAATDPLPLDKVGARALDAAVQARTGTTGGLSATSPEFHAAVAAHLSLMRETVWEVAGNPFQPPRFLPAWRTDTVTALAKQMYESRDFTAMPILADALQDAGCDSDALLRHCRGEGTHVRGCWAIDLVLELE